MKILIINDFFRHGGAEVQSLREKELLEKKGHEVKLLIFDQNYTEKANDSIINIPIKKNKIFLIRRKIVGNIFTMMKIKKYIKIFNPDIIHVNNLYIDPLTQYKALKNYKVLQTIRDYNFVCPIGTCIDENYNICTGRMFNNCKVKCKKKYTNKFLNEYMNNKVNKLRNKNIDKFICPSQKLTQYCINHEYDTVCINNPFDFDKLKTFRKKNIEKKSYLYYGAINTEKGVFKLIEAFDIFSKDKDVELYLAGKIKEEEKDYFYGCINENTKIKYLGQLQYSEILVLLQNIYCIVVPSLWMENYPNTILEGLSTKTLVIGSNRGGIPDMLMNDSRLIFDIKNINSIINVLSWSFDLLEINYNEIVDFLYKYTINNNSLEMYYSRLLKEFNNVIK